MSFWFTAPGNAAAGPIGRQVPGGDLAKLRAQIEDSTGTTDFRRHNNAIALAVQNPGQFLANRNIAINNAIDQTWNDANGYYTRLIANGGITQEEATARTLSYAEGLRDLYFQDVEDEFPMGALPEAVARVQMRDETRRTAGFPNGVGGGGKLGMPTLERSSLVRKKIGGRKNRANYANASAA